MESILNVAIECSLCLFIRFQLTHTSNIEMFMKTDYAMDYLANQQADKLATLTHDQIQTKYELNYKQDYCIYNYTFDEHEHLTQQNGFLPLSASETVDNQLVDFC